MNLATFIEPPNRLGAPSDVDMTAWEVYFGNLRDSTVRSWNEARGAYVALKEVKEIFGEPFIVAAGETDPGTGITAARNQEYLELAATNDYLATLMDEVLAGERKVFYDADNQDFAIEMLETDTMYLAVQNTRTVLLDKATNQPIEVKGTLGVAPAIIWGGIVAGTAIAGMISYYFINDSNNQRAKIELEEKTKQAIATKQADLVASGKATPEQAKQMTDAIYVGAKDLELAKAETEKAKKAATSEGIQETVKTVMWIGLGIGALYFLARVVPAATAATEKRIPPQRQLTANPTHTYRFYSYDVWGNEEDGYEVNDVFRTTETVELDDEKIQSDTELFKELKKQGFIDQPGVQSRHFETDGDEEIIYLTYKGRPEGELRRET